MALNNPTRHKYRICEKIKFYLTYTMMLCIRLLVNIYSAACKKKYKKIRGMFRDCYQEIFNVVI